VLIPTLSNPTADVIAAEQLTRLLLLDAGRVEEDSNLLSQYLFKNESMRIRKICFYYRSGILRNI
jgi:hypothetical protein